MGDYTPKVGDKVVYCGPNVNKAPAWERRRDEPGIVAVSSDKHVSVVPLYPGKSINDFWVAPTTSVRVVERATYERLPDPEPEYQPGDVVLDGNGYPARRIESESYLWQRFGGEFVADQDLPKPLTLIARDGKPCNPDGTPREVTS